MAPKIQDGDLLLVDPRCAPEDHSIVVARIKDEIVCRRLVISGEHTLLVPDNLFPEDETALSDPCFIETGGEVEVLGRVKKIERWPTEDAEILGPVAGSYRMFVDDTSPSDAHDKPIGDIA